MKKSIKGFDVDISTTSYGDIRLSSWRLDDEHATHLYSGLDYNLNDEEDVNMVLQNFYEDKLKPTFAEMLYAFTEEFKNEFEGKLSKVNVDALEYDIPHGIGEVGKYVKNYIDTFVKLHFESELESTANNLKDAVELYIEEINAGADADNIFPFVYSKDGRLMLLQEV